MGTGNVQRKVTDLSKMKPGKALPAKSLYPLAEVAALVGCTTCDLVHYAVQRRISLLVGVPERLSVLVYEDSTRKHSAPMSLSPQMLSLSANQCLKLEMQGRIQQSDFVSAYVLESDGKLTKILPNSGPSDLDTQKFFWRLAAVGQVFRLEILPEQLFVTHDDLMALMGEGSEALPQQILARKEKRPPAHAEASEETPTTGSGGQQEVEGLERTAAAKKSEATVPVTLKPSPTGPMILRLKQVMERTGLSRSTIYDRMSPSSPRHDPSFPKQVSLGGDAVGWVQDEVEAWLQVRIVAGRP